MFHKTLLAGSILVGSFCYPIQGSLGLAAVKNSKGDVTDGSETPLDFSMRAVLLKKRKIDKKLFDEKIKRKRKKKERQRQIEQWKKREQKRKVVKQQNEGVTYLITAYTAGAESTGKNPGDSGYGITASGKYVQQGVTISCPPQLALGTKVYIPDLHNTYVCEDRGSKIKGRHIDLYMNSLSAALQFGRQYMKVEIIK